MFIHLPLTDPIPVGEAKEISMPDPVPNPSADQVETYSLITFQKASDALIRGRVHYIFRRSWWKSGKIRRLIMFSYGKTRHQYCGHKFVLPTCIHALEDGVLRMWTFPEEDVQGVDWFGVKDLKQEPLPGVIPSWDNTLV